MCNIKLNLTLLKMHKKWDLHVLIRVEFEYVEKICVSAIFKADARIQGVLNHVIGMKIAITTIRF